MMHWKYYGQHSGVDIYRIFRCPDNGISLWDQPLVERAFPNHVWREDPQAERLLRNEHLQGWFSEETDELTETEALAMLAEWDRNGWLDLPGKY
jgi:hypothetical protein